MFFFYQVFTFLCHIPNFAELNSREKTRTQATSAGNIVFSLRREPSAIEDESRSYFMHTPRSFVTHNCFLNGLIPFRSLCNNTEDKSYVTEESVLILGGTEYIDISITRNTVPRAIGYTFNNPLVSQDANRYLIHGQECFYFAVFGCV